MVQVKQVLLSTHITAVKVKENIVFIGEGQYLYVHNLLTGEKLAEARIFLAAAIHGIKIISVDESPHFWRLLVWGQKSLSVVLFETTTNKCLVRIKEKHLEDWIVDAAWEDLTHIVLATAHNTLLYVKVNEGPSEYIHTGSGIVRPLENDNCGVFEIKEKQQCAENCILYCGLIIVGSGFHGSAVLLAGTVFSHVLIWGPLGEKNKYGNILPHHCLSGHQGVLFSINFCHERNIITTTSDDRTLRIWKIRKKHECDQNDERYWNSCQIKEERKCYGHDSRVWKSLILPFCYLSVGEDSKICMWDLSGSLKMCWQGHNGACIWSIDSTDNGSIIVTGGGDGSVKSWCLNLDAPKNPEVMIKLPWVDSHDRRKSKTLNVNFQNKNVQLTPSEIGPHDMKCDDAISRENKHSSDSEICWQRNISIENVRKDKKCSLVTEDFPRCVALLGLETFLVMLDSGKLYSWDCHASLWSLVYENQRLKGYSVMTSIPDKHVVALATLCGCIVILVTDKFSGCIKVVIDEKVIDGKIFSLHWLNENEFLINGSDGRVVIWKFDIFKGTIKKEQTCVLPLCKQRWVSAASYFPSQDSVFLLCGDRAGSIHLYSKNSVEPLHSLRSIHGKNGVTSLTTYRGQVYSTGRDGCIRCLTVHENILQVITVTRVSSVNWVSSLINLHDRQLAVCFHDVKLKLWSLEDDRAVTDIECGGGHRSWALQFSEEYNRLSFIFIKDTKPYTFCTTLKDKLMPLIKTPVNTRETMCLDVLLQKGDVTYFVTGGEDTTLRLHTISSCTKKKINTFNVIRSHVSNVRALCCIDNVNETEGQSYCDKGTSKWIVSAGGRAQVKVWKMTYLNSDVDPLGICYREVTSNMLRTGSNKTWKSQEMTFDPETRYMDATAFWISKEKAVIILASSDGYIRFFEYDDNVERLRLLCSQAWDHCLLKLQTLHVHHLCILVSAATDGILVFWNIQPLLDCIANPSSSFDDCHIVGVDKITSIRSHQSGINSVAITSQVHSPTTELNPESFIIASGGDDNKISLWKLTGYLTEGKILTFSSQHICEVNGHSSQVTGLSWLTPCHLISTSIDQRVIIWKLKQVNKSDSPYLNSSSVKEYEEKSQHKQNSILADDDSSMQLEPLSTHFTGVPDVKGLTVSNKFTAQSKDNPASNNTSLSRVFIYGVGLQVYDVEINET